MHPCVLVRRSALLLFSVAHKYSALNEPVDTSTKPPARSAAWQGFKLKLEPSGGRLGGPCSIAPFTEQRTSS